MALVIPLAMHAQTCEISYSLIDSYGDGWNGAAINVLNVATNEIIASWTISSGNNTASGTLSVSNGQIIRFEWTRGSYDDECSYIVYGVNGELILNDPVKFNAPITKDETENFEDFIKEWSDEKEIDYTPSKKVIKGLF